jgi:hypothetical protein
MNDVLNPTGRSAGRFARTFLNSHPSAAVFLVAALVWLKPSPASAVPYASRVINAAGTVSFILNEAADNVTVVLDGGASSMDLGALPKGAHSFGLGTATAFSIVVSKSVPPAWTQISTDTNEVRFFSARGVAVNLNPATPLFGRIYVANAVAGTTAVGARATGDGIYALNADQSDAVGQGNTALTGGLNFTTSPALQNGNSPWRLEIGPDDRLYISDFATNLGTIYRTDPNVSTGEQVLAGQGSIGPNANLAVHSTIGGSPIVTGSLETSDLTIWAIDGALPNNFNRLMRWDIGAGPLPSSVAPVAVHSAYPTTWIGSVANVTTDNDTAPDGKFFIMENRSDGDQVGLAVLDTAGNTIWNSILESRSISNNPTGRDILRLSRAVKVSPDGRRVAIIRDDNQTWVLPLTNGIPDLGRRVLVPTFPTTPTIGRDVCWDAAGNLYVVSSGAELLRVWSPGGTTTATTRSDGTFSVDVVPVPEVSVTLTDADASEEGPDAITFTLTRTEDPSNPLTITYTLTGTAINGTDYETNALSLTFGANESTATVTITPIDDSIPELGETVVLTISPGAGYLPGFPSSATTGIADNEPDVISITAVEGQAYERLPQDTITFRVDRLGETNSELFVVYEPNAGTATHQSDFTSGDGQGLSGTVLLLPGQLSQTFTVVPLDDLELEGNETVGIMILPGLDPYTPGTPDTAYGTIVDNELPPGAVLFSDDLDADTSADWTVLFGANNGVYDADVRWAFDYSTLNPPIPPAPSSPGTTLGVFLQVNRTNAQANGAAAVNLYPNGRAFSGNFALRADMYLSYDTTPAGSTEHALLGLNHSGLLTNRFTLTTGNPAGSTVGGDGVWAAIGTDASNSRDWAAYYATNAASLPHLYTNRSAASVAGLVSAPPYALAGSPGNRSASGTKTWAEMELSQSNNVITLKVNNSVVYSFPNPSGFVSGDIMIGHNDSADSIGSLNNFVIFDNIRVVTYDTRITSVQLLPGDQVQIDFISPGQVSDFHLDSTPGLLPEAWREETTAALTVLPAGFRFVVARNGDSRFYRIRR